MIAVEVMPGDVARFVDKLDDLEVTYPDQVASAMAFHATIADGTMVATAGQVSTPDLLAMDRAALAAHIKDVAAVRSLVGESLGNAAWEVDQQLCAAAVVLLREHADDILDQLRPAFDTAAKAVHEAVAVGVQSGMGAQQVIGVGDRAVRAWRGLPPHIATLDRIAALRRDMTFVLDVAPHADKFRDNYRNHGAAFSPSGMAMERADRQRVSTADMWLRLSTGEPEPLRLMTLEETATIDRGARSEPVPLVIESEDGRLQLGRR